jgi:P-type Ca2+ transporter type 2C
MALAVDPAPPGLMDRQPQRAGIITWGMLGMIAGVGLVIAVVVLGIFAIGAVVWDMETARTIAFTAFVVQEYLKLAVLRRQEGMALWSNRMLVVAVAASLTLQMLIVYTPVAGAFDAAPLGVGPLVVLLGGLVIGYLVAAWVAAVVARRFGPI